jgi:methyl-accepting chemotaxis protein
MLATFLNSPLKRRFMIAAGTLSLTAFAWLSLACLVAGTVAGFWLIRRVVDRFSAPLRAVTASLQGGTNGELDPVGFGDTAELRELAGAVNAMRTNLRSSTI